MTDKKEKVQTDRYDPLIDNKDTVDDKQLIEQLRQEFDDLVKKYNKQQEQLEGAETHNSFLEAQVSDLQREVSDLQHAVKVLDNALNKPNKRLWVKFDCSNTELTRPLYNIMLRNKDRPKQFYIEVMDGDVVEVSETKL